jgi:hypothetical protein
LIAECLSDIERILQSTEQINKVAARQFTISKNTGIDAQNPKGILSYIYSPNSTRHIKKGELRTTDKPLTIPDRSIGNLRDPHDRIRVHVFLHTSMPNNEAQIGGNMSPHRYPKEFKSLSVK